MHCELWRVREKKWDLFSKLYAITCLRTCINTVYDGAHVATAAILCNGMLIFLNEIQRDLITWLHEIDSDAMTFQSLLRCATSKCVRRFAHMKMVDAIEIVNWVIPIEHHLYHSIECVFDVKWLSTLNRSIYSLTHTPIGSKLDRNNIENTIRNSNNKMEKWVNENTKNRPVALSPHTNDRIIPAIHSIFWLLSFTISSLKGRRKQQETHCFHFNFSLSVILSHSL